MGKSRVFSLVFFISSLLSSPLLHAQQNTAGQGGESFFDLGLKTGSFLPSDIDGVEDLLPFFGVKLGHSFTSTISLEYDFDAAHAKGVDYYLTYFSLRHDFDVGDVIPFFFLIGVDGHYYKAADAYDETTGARTDEYDYNFSTGWHVGFGSQTVIYRSILIRGDVRMGFSPGRTLSVSIGIVNRF